MPIEKHDLHHEFPEFHDEIHELKMTDNHFAQLGSNGRLMLGKLTQHVA